LPESLVKEIWETLFEEELANLNENFLLDNQSFPSMPSEFDDDANQIFGRARH